MTAEEFIRLARVHFPDITKEMEDRFRLLEPLYNEWNARINVISRKDISSLYLRHVMHSLSIAAYIRRENPELHSAMSGRGKEPKDSKVKILDLGTGGGFPGIPLAIMYPNADFTLCDSVGKKTIVAGEVAESLGLENATIVNARAESLNETFDFVVSRAVTSLDNFVPWVAGKYTRNIFYLKGGDFAEEVCNVMSKYGLAPGSIKTWKLTDWIDDEIFTEKYIIDIPAVKGKSSSKSHTCSKSKNGTDKALKIGKK